MYKSLIAALVLVASIQPAAAITVNSTADTPDTVPGDATCGTGLPNTCTLRAAIQEANANAATTNTIDLSTVTGTITLTSSLPVVTKPVAITGPTAGITIDGNSATIPANVWAGLRFTGTGGAYSVSNLTIKNTKTADGLGGAALYFAPTGVSQLNLTNLTFTGNNATGGPGGALVVDLGSNGSSFKGDYLTIGGSTAANANQTSGASNGGGVSVRAVGATTTMWIDHSQILGNTSGANGGGITVKRGQLQVSNSTIKLNSTAATSGLLGGGIYLDTESSTGGSVRLENVTISGNTADQGGGIGVSATNGVASWVTFSTITANTANAAGNKGGGIMSSAANVNFPGNLSNPFTSNIVAANTGGNCGNAFSHSDTANSGYNLTDDASCGFTQSTDQTTATTAALKIGSLASTPSTALPTHALLAGSPAIDHGNPAWMNTTTIEDERGADAQDGDLSNSGNDPVRDVGAYEFGGFGLVQFGFPSGSTFPVNEDAGPVLVLIKRYGSGTAAATAPKVAFSTSVSGSSPATAGTAGSAACTPGSSDYNGLTNNPTDLTFALAGPTQFDQTVSLPICNDAVAEGAEFFDIALAKSSTGDSIGYDLGPNVSGTVTINDAENGVFTLTTPGSASATPYPFAEGNVGTGAQIPVTITRSGGSKGVVRVTYSTITSTACQSSVTCTATSDTDFTAVTNGTVDFADGQTSKNVMISIIGDTAFEADEIFQVKLNGVACQGLAAGQSCDAHLNGNATDVSKFATITINNDDAAKPGKLEYEFTTYTINESQSTLTVNVKRTGGSDGDVTVTYGATAGSATTPGDYIVPPDPVNNHVLTWLDGDATDKTASFTIVNDGAIESNKTFSATLSSPTGCPDAGNPSNCATVGTNAPATVTIVSADQPTIEFKLASASVDEVDGSITLEVTSDAFTGQSVTVPFYTTDGTAISPTDYSGVSQASPTTLTFDGSGTSQTKMLTIISDGVAEGNETFSGVLGTPVGGAVLGAHNPIPVTIVDPTAIRFTAVNYSSANEANGGTITFTVERIGDSTGMVSVNFDISQACTNPAPAGCAEEGVDYTRAGGFSGSKTWVGTDNNPNESATQTFSVTVIGDSAIEGNETFNATLSNAGNAVLGTPTLATGTITDDDYQFKIVDVSPVVTSEGAGNAVITVQRVGSTLGAASVKYATTDGTAVAGSDYTATATPSPSLTWAAGVGGTKQILVPVTDDLLDEVDETFTVTLSSPSANVNGEPTTIANSPVTVQITDNDAPPTVSFNADQGVTEGTGAGTTTATVTATLSAVSSKDVTVPYTIGGTATAADHNAVAGTISIPAGSTSGTFNVTITRDALDEDDETIVATMGTPTNATAAAPTTTTITILDDDASPTVSFNADQGVTEGTGAGTTTATITATLSAVSGRTVSVPFAIGGTATAADHDAVAGTISIPAGATTGTLTVAITRDALDEDDETVVATMGNPTNATAAAPTTTTITILDDDLSPTVSFNANQAVTEGTGAGTTTATVTATLSAVSGRTVTVPYTIGGTASGADHDAVDGSISIPAGATAGTFTVTITRDAVDEDDETVVATMGTPTNATAAAPTATTLTILDDDASPTVSFAAAQSVVEGTGAGTTTATVTATLSAVSGRTVSVPFTVGGTATAADHNAVAGTITIAAGATTGSTSFTVVRDSINESNETVVFTMGTPTNATAAAPTSHTVTITDDDAAPTVNFSNAAQAITEGTGSGTTPVTVTATLSAVSGQTVTVPFTISGTADVNDSNAVSGSISIPAGQTSGTYNFGVGKDSDAESNETLIFTMGTPTNATKGTTVVHTVTITNDDVAPDSGGGGSFDLLSLLLLVPAWVRRRRTGVRI